MTISLELIRLNAELRPMHICDLISHVKFVFAPLCLLDNRAM